jgi:hypothetical protein
MSFRLWGAISLRCTLLAASLAVAGCDLSYTGLHLSSCDGGSFPGAICPGVGSGGSTGTRGTGSGASGGSGASSSSAGGASSGGKPTGSTGGSTALGSSSSGGATSAATSTGTGTSAGAFTGTGTSGGASTSAGGSSSGGSPSSGTTGASGGSSGGSTGAACATLTVDVAYDYSTEDFQGVVAVENGTPYLNMLAAQPMLWNLEQAKSWTTINDYIASEPGVEQLFTACLPPGNYTVQYWDIWGQAGTFDNGTPPTVTYTWQIGDSSREISLAPGDAGFARVENTQTNVPSSDNFYGSYGLWSYGSCNDGGVCSSGTTCYQGTCYDMGYDIRNCGSGGNACNAEACCSGSCTDTGSDPNNCGGCGVVCSAGTVCTTGQCVAEDASCGIVTVELGADSPNDPTNYQGLSAVADGLPYQDFSLDDEALWPAEEAKSWTTFANDLGAGPFIETFYSVCVPPGSYTVQYWNIGCVNNSGGCGTYDNGTPPGVNYVWQIGDSSRILPVTAGAITPVSVERTETNVPDLDNFYGSYSLWSYGGCATGQSACPTGTTCYQEICYDMGYDIRNCGSGGFACVAEDCCDGLCTDESSDPNNCGGCGLVCSSGQTCSNGFCQ